MPPDPFDDGSLGIVGLDVLPDRREACLPKCSRGALEGLADDVGDPVCWGPLETLRRTSLPSTMLVPPFGSCAMTSPAGLSEKMSTTLGLRPALRKVATASDSRAPTTSGTSTLGFPVETK